MVNVAILTTKHLDLTKLLINYFKKININVSCVISNDLKTNNLDNKLRRYKVKTYNTDRYKEIDKLFTEHKINYIVLSDYNDIIPPNFAKKYKFKIINYKIENNELIFYYVNDKNNTNYIIFKVTNYLIDSDNFNDLLERYYPIIIEKIINMQINHSK